MFRLMQTQLHTHWSVNTFVELVTASLRIRNLLISFVCLTYLVEILNKHRRIHQNISFSITIQKFFGDVQTLVPVGRVNHISSFGVHAIISVHTLGAWCPPCQNHCCAQFVTSSDVVIIISHIICIDI